MESEQQLWHKREDEPSRCWSAFCIYRDLGPSRSLRETSYLYKIRIEGGDPQQTSKDDATDFKISGHIGEWSSKYDWVARAAAYDQHLDMLAVKVAQEEWIEKAKELQRKNWEAQAILFDAAVKVSKLTIDYIDTLNVSDLNPSHVSKNLKAAAEVLERGFNFANNALRIDSVLKVMESSENEDDNED